MMWVGFPSNVRQTTPNQQFAAGAVNGTVSSVLKIPPLVVTLATMTLFRGVAFGLSEADAISQFPKGFKYLGSGDLFSFHLNGSPVFVPVALGALVVTVLIGGFILRNTWMGRYTLALGENPAAAIQILCCV
ncbi:ABC transporter permease [Thioclava electrotropha]|uniref:ABC transporter permease n=1 Tax=Thioclava electrotropha TaxID=1549850 RepID=UPI0023A8B66D|nr:hypothetical protein [Thioclava electrotropha]